MHFLYVNQPSISNDDSKLKLHFAGMTFGKRRFTLIQVNMISSVWSTKWVLYGYVCLMPLFNNFCMTTNILLSILCCGVVVVCHPSVEYTQLFPFYSFIFG